MIFKDKTILVTGGTGSMGGKLVHRVFANELGTQKKVVVFSRAEAPSRKTLQRGSFSGVRLIQPME